MWRDHWRKQNTWGEWQDGENDWWECEYGESWCRPTATATASPAVEAADTITAVAAIATATSALAGATTATPAVATGMITVTPAQMQAGEIIDLER